MPSSSIRETIIENTDKPRKTVKADSKPAQPRTAARKSGDVMAPDAGHKGGVSRAAATVNKAHGTHHASDTHDGIQKPHAMAKNAADALGTAAVNGHKTGSAPASGHATQHGKESGVSHKAHEDKPAPALSQHLGKVGWAAAAVAAGAIGAVVVGAVRMHTDHKATSSTVESANEMGPGGE